MTIVILASMYSRNYLKTKTQHNRWWNNFISQLSLKLQRHLFSSYKNIRIPILPRKWLCRPFKENAPHYIVSVKLLRENSHLDWFLKHITQYAAAVGLKYRLLSPVYVPASSCPCNLHYLVFHWFIGFFCRFISSLWRL